jgi:hypothetical protein
VFNRSAIFFIGYVSLELGYIYSLYLDISGLVLTWGGCSCFEISPPNE